MSTRFLVFYAFALVGVLTLSYFQNLYYPAVPANAIQESNQPAEVADDNVETKIESAVGDSAQNELAQSELTGETEAAESADNDESSKPDDKKQASELHSIGSLAPDSPYRYLVTLDSAGGTVRRVELNFRNAKNRHRYRDLEFKGGYLGELDCVDSSKGCLVRVVGDGTPAFEAGIKKGDVVESIDGEPVVTAEDLQNMLENTKPGQSLSISIARGEAKKYFDVELTDKPIELLRPQPDILNKGWPALPSFRTKLLEFSPKKAIWPELDKNMRGGVWKIANKKADLLTFEYQVEAATISQNNSLANSGLVGPFNFKKTFRLPPLEKEDKTEFARDFHINMDFEIENLSDQPQKVCYQMDGPLGTPSETWWYQIKIHGETWALFRTAGARDVIGSTGQEEYKFFGCPSIVSNMRKTAPEFFWLLAPPSANDPTLQQVNSLSVDSQYFNVSMLPDPKQPAFTAYSVLADTTELGGDKFPKDVKVQKLVDVTFRMYKDVDLKPNGSYNQSFEIFCGPKDGELLQMYGLDSARTFGWFSWFSKPLCGVLKFLHWVTFQLGYGIPIILLTMLVRCLMIPISRRAALNAQMMQYLQPQMKEIADKYKDDMEMRGQAQKDLFKKYKYNPFSGCVMMFFQLPIFIGLYRGLSVDIALRDQPLFPGLGWCSNLSAPDQFWYWKDYIPISWLTSETGWLGPYLNILPIFACLLFVMQQKLFTPPPTDEQQEMMQKVMKYAMIFMGVLFFKVPAGLCLYIITSSLWAIVERKMLPKPELDTSKLDTIGGDSAKKNDASAKQIQKQQKQAQKQEQVRIEQQEEKKKRDKERKKKLKQRGV